MGSLWQDLRYGLRMLAKSPGFTAVAALTLALGIGANTAIFSAVNAILFESLPYPDANRLMMIWDTFQGERSDVTFHTYREAAQRNRSFSEIAAMDVWQPTLTGPEEPERLDGQSVSASYFQVLGVKPEIGRDFQASDDVMNGAKVAILSYGLWQRRYSGDREILGRQITLDGDSYTVIGVMPRGFENVLESSSEIWSPLQYDTSHITNYQTGEWGHHMHMVGRLRQGLSTDQAKQDLDRIAHDPVPEFPRPPWASLKYGFIVNALQGDVTRGVRSALLAIFGAVTLVLLIACVNVTNLLLARGAQRRGEFAMRAALGAGRARVIRQLLTESLFLSLLGGALGLVVAELGVSAIIAVSPAELPRLGDISVNGPVFAFAFLITTVIGLLVGLVPALDASRADLRNGMQQGSRQSSGGHQWTRRTLVVAEVALALVLLVSAGLLLRSLQRVFGVAPGFDASNLLTMQVQTSGHRFDDLTSAPGAGNTVRRAFFTQALDEVRHVPGVTSAALTSLLPLDSQQFEFNRYGAAFENEKPGEGGRDVFRYVISPGYLETMGIPLRRGRFLDERDAAGAPQAVLISESLAKSEFPGRDPIGGRVHVGPMDRPWYTIVGVVGDVKQTSLAVSNPDAVYITSAQSWFADDAMSLVVRTRGDAAALATTVRKAIWSVDKDQPILRVATMDDLLAKSEAQRRFALILFEAFGIVALALAATGIYGVLSGSVTERTHEIGVRAALGAQRGDVLRLILGDAARLVLLGIAIGIAGALGLTRVMASLLFEVKPTDPGTFSSMAILLAAVGMAACYFPARRAMSVDPMTALRHE
ncbi:MAG: ABC transporter permease [Candidatus Acidiferrales bacterium]